MSPLLRRSAFLLGLLLAFGAVHGAELAATADTWVHGATDYRNQNYGHGEFLKVRSRGARIALVQFDTASLGAGAAPGARLSLHVSRVVAPGVVQIRPVVTGWSEDEVTYTTRPMTGAEIIGTINVTAADAGNRVSVDVSPLVAAWIADPTSNFGLAITADGTTADVYFGTRDVGTAPELVVAATNSVTVSRAGGDYADPVAAANNALYGDTWCINPMPDSPCTIDIDEGIYVLSETLIVPDDVVVGGAGKTATVLVAAPGLEVAAEAAVLSDLSLINRQTPSLARAVGLRPSSLRDPGFTRVAVRAEGAIDNIALEIVGGSSTVLISESDIAAAGGQNAFAIDMNRGGESVEIHMSRISATGASESNEGITKFFDTGGGVTLTDTAVIASGGRQAAGISIGDEEGGTVTVRGGSVVASADERAFGITGGEYSQDLSVQGARIVVASRGEATGIGWYGVNHSEAIIADVLVDSTDVAIAHYIEESAPTNIWTVTRSQLTGQRRAVDIGHGGHIGIVLSIDDSVLQGEEWIGTAGGEDVIDVSDSVLAGAANISGGGIATCTNVLGGDYRPLDVRCLPME